jgi:hypothetical protein
MDVPEVSHSRTQDNSIRDDLRKFQGRYLRITSRILFLNDRYFQMGMTILVTVGAFIIAYMSPYRPYSIIWGLAMAAMQWYVFVLYDKLRVRIKTDADEHDPLAYFGRKLAIITQIASIRKATAVNSIFIILCIWATRTPDRLFDKTAMGLGFSLILMLMAAIIH